MVTTADSHDASISVHCLQPTVFKDSWPSLCLQDHAVAPSQIPSLGYTPA